MKKFLIRITLFFLMLVFSSCSGIISGFHEDIYTNVYGIIENGKVNRMNLSRKEIRAMERIIDNKYEIAFRTYRGQYTMYFSCGNEYSFKFYNDFKYTVNGKEYIIPKEKILLDYESMEYIIPVPVDILKTSDDTFILEIGEIEIYDENKKLIREKRKVPPLLFKKVRERYLMNYIGSYSDYYYYGWAEDYPKDPSTLKKIEPHPFRSPLIVSYPSSKKRYIFP